MKNFFIIFITCSMTISTFAADSYYANAADEARGKAEYKRLQREVQQTAEKDAQRRKQLNAREGEIILTNDEIDQRLDLMGRYITHPESKRAMDFVNNAKRDPYVADKKDDVNMDGFYRQLPDGSRQYITHP